MFRWLSESLVLHCSSIQGDFQLKFVILIVKCIYLSSSPITTGCCCHHHHRRSRVLLTEVTIPHSGDSGAAAAEEETRFQNQNSMEAKMCPPAIEFPLKLSHPIPWPPPLVWLICCAGGQSSSTSTGQKMSIVGVINELINRRRI